MTADMDLVRALAVMRPGSPVLSLHLRTDPRDPANTGLNPGWLVGLRNGLRHAAGSANEEGRPRDERLAVRALLEQAEADVTALSPAERGRGLAWFRTPDGTLDRRLALQLPPRAHVVVLDERPFVTPLVDVVDRGRPTGIVLVGGDAVRLLHWAMGLVSEPQPSLYELELGDWRDAPGYAVRHPARRNEAYEQRADEWRQKFLRDAAVATAVKLDELGWDRLLVAGERNARDRFLAELPDRLRQRVVAEDDANLLWADPAAVAERIEEDLDAAWRRDGAALVERAVAAAYAGGAGAVGWDEVLDMLVHHRVEHLVFSAGADPDPAAIAPRTLQTLGSPPRRLLVERAVEHAVGSNAGVTVLPPPELSQFAEAGGAAATLRY